MMGAAAVTSSVGTEDQGGSHRYGRHHLHLHVCQLIGGRLDRLHGLPATWSSKVHSICDHKPTALFSFPAEIPPSKWDMICFHKFFETV